MEIDITPEMLAAGAEALRGELSDDCFNYVTTWPEGVAEKVFLAMIAAVKD